MARNYQSLRGGGSAAAEWPLIDRLLRRAGITAEAVFTAHRYHAVELTVAAVNDGIRHIIAVGGDTTLHEVVNGSSSNGPSGRKR